MDLSFNKFLTTALVKIIWIIGIAWNICSAIAVVVVGITKLPEGEGSGAVWMIIGGPVLAVLSLLVLRVWLELIIVLFKIADNTSKLVQLNEHQAVTIQPSYNRPAPAPLIT